jgi:hypothetical protein
MALTAERAAAIEQQVCQDTGALIRVDPICVQVTGPISWYAVWAEFQPRRVTERYRQLHPDWPGNNAVIVQGEACCLRYVS